MRLEAKEQINDLVYQEATNDDLIDSVIKLEVHRRLHEVDEWELVDVTPSLAYMLIDELNLGLSGHPNEVQLQVKMQCN